MTEGARDRADVLIVGGGSAGAVLAARLSQEPATSVVLLEAGPAYAAGEFPDALVNPSRVGGDAVHDWGYPARGSARSPESPVFRGKTLGGSSTINAAIAIRARPGDFARWRDDGVEGWSCEDVLATFRELENPAGPFPIRRLTYAELTPSMRGFIDAAVHWGHQRIEDFNGAEQRGVDADPVTIVDGVRQNTALVHLTPEVRRRPNLTLRGDVLVDRVLIDNGRASGVRTDDGTVWEAGEAILSAGAYGSPAILLRSGVGPAGDLRELGIDVVADLPVGKRLQDHPFYYNAYALADHALEMTPTGNALLWTASGEATGDELDLRVTATHFLDPSASPTGGVIVLSVGVTQPDSTGTVRLRSTDPRDAPVIDCGFLVEPRDRRRLLEGVKPARAIAHDAALAPMPAGEILPGEQIQDDEALLAAVETNLASYGHPTAIAPMGSPHDRWAVADSNGGVHGVAGLRVIDASIVPEVPSAAPHLAVIMIAERPARPVYGTGTARRVVA